MIRITVPGLPPSVNNVYTSIIVKRGAKRIPIRKMTKEGEKYINETKVYIARNFSEEMKFFEKDLPYSIIIELTFLKSDILCAGWPEKAKSRYQTLDVSNRVKVFEDMFVAATGVDDNHNFSVTAAKTWNNHREEVNLWAFCREREQDPIYELLRKLRA